MVARNGISRRRMLAMSAGLAVGGGVRASAQVVKRIDKFAPELDNVISATEPILELGSGFGGGGNTEGPVWWSDGAVYFTDPWNIQPLPEQWDLQFNGVFRVAPDLGSISLLVDHFVLPNGLAFSPDENVLYINDSRRRQIRAFDVMPSGLLARQSERVFVELAGAEPGGPDGMKVDTAGNVYCGGPGGIYVMDPKGNKLGRIVHGQPQTTNLAFGGDDWKTLFFTTRTTFGSVRVKIAGVPVPAPRRS